MKLLIKLDVPAIAASYELLLPEDLAIRQILDLLVKGAAELSGNSYVPSGREFLCAEAYDLPLNENLTLSDYGIENGDRLLLI